MRCSPARASGDDEDGRLARRVFGGRALQQQARRAARHGVGREVVAVGALAAQGDEEIARLDATRVDDGAPEVRVGASLLAQRVAQRAGDEGRIEGGTAPHRAAHGALTRRSPGGTRRYSMMSVAIVEKTGAATMPARLESPRGSSILTRMVTRGCS